MKKVLLLIAAMFAIAVSAQSVKVKGTILFSESGEPLSSVTVEIRENGETIATGQTDSRGKFCLTTRPGKYDIRFLAIHYNPLVVEGADCRADIALAPIKMQKAQSMMETDVVRPVTLMIDAEDPNPVMQRVEVEGVKVNVR